MTTGPREAGVLSGQARARIAARQSTRDDDVIALERMAAALEGIEVSLALLADVVEAQAYGVPDGEGFDLAEEEAGNMGCA
jgi:hypothetical protein